MKKVDILKNDIEEIKASGIITFPSKKREKTRQEQIADIKHRMNRKCGTPLLRQIMRIREEGASKGWSKEHVKQLCDDASEMQSFRFFRADKLNMRVIELMEGDVNISYEEARKISEEEIYDEEKIELYAHEFFTKERPDLAPDQYVERWKKLTNKFEEDNREGDRRLNKLREMLKNE